MKTQLCVHNFCKGSNKYPLGTSYPAELNAKMKKKKYIFYENMGDLKRGTVLDFSMCLKLTCENVALFAYYEKFNFS
jgi:hypothetical protein